MTAVLYFATAIVLLWLVDRYVINISRGAAIALLLLPLCFTGRALLTGRVYAPVEMAYISRPLADYRESLRVPPVQNPLLSDIAFQMVPWRESLRRSLAAGEWPLLNRFMMCGDVLLGAGQPAAFNPFTLIACLLPSAVSFTFTASIAFFIAGLGAFVFARALDRSFAASLIAAIGWMFSAPIALHILYPLGFAWTLLPFVLAAIRLRSVGALTVALSLEILAGHPETVLHVTTIAGAYAIFEMWSARDRAKLILTFASAGVLALLVTAIHLLPVLDAVRKTGEYLVRAHIYARLPLRIPTGFATAAAVSDLFPFLRARFADFLLPRAEGGSILLALAILAVLCVRSREVWFFAGLLVIAFLAGTDAWPFAHLLHRVPFFNQAINDRLSAAVPMCLAILAAFAVDAWSPKRGAAAMGILAIAIGIVAIIFRSADHARLAVDLVPLAVAASLVLIVKRWDLTVALLVGLLLLQRTIAGGLLVPVHLRSTAYPPLAILQPLKGIGEPFRIVGTGMVFLPNTATMYGLEDPIGSTPMTLAEYAETYPLWLTRPPGQFPRVNDLTRPFLAMMNVRYALTDAADTTPAGWHEITTVRRTRLVENDHVRRRAFIPRHVRLGPSDLEAMSRETDFSERSWLEVPGQQEERENGPGQVAISPRKLGFDLEVVMQSAGFVVISEASWPAWRAYVDGQRVKILRANHAFLGVYVPQGRHHVRLLFMPQSFVVGRAITFATLLLLVVYRVIVTVVVALAGVPVSS
ncbi:MAG TPA: YfhO family protein [Thermoanaerobaculia bacterium]